MVAVEVVVQELAVMVPAVVAPTMLHTLLAVATAAINMPVVVLVVT